MSIFDQTKQTLDSKSQLSVDNLIILSRADPIICGHSTETRNLAEAALRLGIQNVHIVSYPLDVLASSGLPLKPEHSVGAYSAGITVDRPAPVGDYKVLDGRLSAAISGHVINLLSRLSGKTAVMDLYLVPHGQMVMQAVASACRSGIADAPVTIGEAVGSDITNVVSNALVTGQSGAAALLMQNYLDHDQPVAVSAFTRELIVASGAMVDEALGTNFAQQLSERVRISYPAIDTAAYLSPTISESEQAAILSRRGLVRDGYILFLSRLTKAKGVEDLIHAYRESKLYRRLPLVICGSGPDELFFHKVANSDTSILFFNDISDLDKLALMSGCHAYCLPSKPRVEFTETFGIAIAEAMLSGGIGPVITTRTGGIPEATGDHCLYHKAGDIADLVACLNRVASMPDHFRAHLSQQARNYACRFDREKILKNLLTETSVQALA